MDETKYVTHPAVKKYPAVLNNYLCNCTCVTTYIYLRGTVEFVRNSEAILQLFMSELLCENVLSG